METTTSEGGRAAGNSGATIRGEVSRWEVSLDGGRSLSAEGQAESLATEA